MDMVKTVTIIRNEELKEKYKMTAYGAWLGGAGQGEGSEGSSFDDFLKKIGLEQDEDMQPDEIKEVSSKDEALNIAESILSNNQTWGLGE